MRDAAESMTKRDSKPTLPATGDGAYLLTVDVGGTTLDFVSYSRDALACLAVGALQTDSNAVADGGSGPAVAAVDAGPRDIKRAIRTTAQVPAGAVASVDELVGLIAKQAADQGLGRLAGVGVAVAGSVDAAQGVVMRSPNLALLDDAPLRDKLERELAVPVVVENDANAFALAEAVIGAGRGAGTVVGYTLGTGIGGGVVLDGRIHRGSGVGAAEFGHVMLDADGPECSCGRHGCLEAYIGGWAIPRTVTGMFEHFYGQTDLEGTLVDGKALREAGEEGDEFAMQFWLTYGERLALGVAAIVNVLRPDAIVFGGSGAASLPLYRATFETVLRERVFPPFNEAMRIAVAELPQPGNVGAALLAHERLVAIASAG